MDRYDVDRYDRDRYDDRDYGRSRYDYDRYAGASYRWRPQVGGRYWRGAAWDDEDWDRGHERSGMMGAIRRRPWLTAGLALGAAFLTTRIVRNATQDGQQAQAGTKNSTFLAWLNDAHATEKSLVRLLEKQIKEAEGHPQVKAKLQEHLEATKRHADLVKGCIERRGGHVSAVKSGLGAVMGAVQGMSTGPAKDTLVKNAIAGYAAEHFEIASYHGLIAAAEELGDSETVGVFRQILADEENMAAWLQEHLPGVVREHLQKLPERSEGAMKGSGVLPQGRRADHRFFEEHFNEHFASAGAGFRDYEGAYRYGSRLAGEPGFRDRSWQDIEPEVRSRWEREQNEPWDSRMEAVRYGFNRGTMHRREGPDIEL